MIKLKIYILIITTLFAGVNLSLSQDVTSPDIPILDSVTVNQATLKVNIGWQFSNATDVKGYIIYKKNNFWLAIDTVNSTTNFYEDIASVPNFHKESYRIAAFDSSYNVSPMTDHHTSIYAFPYEKTVDCRTYIEIDWSDYEGWNNLLTYNVLRKTNTGNIVKIAQTTDSYYNDFGIVDSTSYCYYIQAISTDGKTSQSNKTCFFTELPNNPQFINADYVTVENYDYVEVSFTVDTVTALGNYYKLYRATNDTINFTEIDRLDNVTGNKIVSFDDINIYENKYYYKLELYNACDSLIKTSNLAENIILETNLDTALWHRLTWTPYNNWNGNVKRYDIYRYIDNEEPVLIGTSTSTFYKEHVKDYLNTATEGNFCYYVEAIEGINPYEPALDTIRISRSNVACATQGPRVFIPTAFTPYSHSDINRIFKPVISFASPKDYKLVIYDRWGQLVWQTSDSQQGWDGKLKHGRAPEGTYVYVISFTSAENNFITHKGYVTILY